MFTYSGKSCDLVELCQSNEQSLFSLMWAHAEEYRRTVADQAFPDSPQEFAGHLRRWFASGRRYQFLVHRKDRAEGSVVGTVFFIAGATETVVDVSCFFVSDVRRTRLVGEALASAIRFAYLVIGVDDVMFSVYTDNQYMLHLAKKLRCREIDCAPSASNAQRSIQRFLLSNETIAKLVNYFPVPQE